MRTIGLLLVASVVAFGQRAGVVQPRVGVVQPRTFGSASGFGNVVFPGTGNAPPISHSGIGVGARIGSPIVGFPGIGIGGGGGGRRGGRQVVYVPYGVGIPYYYGQPEEPPAMYPPQQMAPQVVINQNFTSETARPIVREYAAEPDGGIRVYPPTRPSAEAAPSVDEPTTYLIAFKDHTIYAALAYWVEGDTLHYITNQNTHNQVSLDLIDRDLSTRFNRERSVDFHLPPAR